jgi:hypothetical protein
LLSGGARLHGIAARKSQRETGLFRIAGAIAATATATTLSE